MERRSFLKVLASTVGLTTLPSGVLVYDEPLVPTTPKSWVVDKGDYYEVWIPDHKTIERESFDKPIVLFLGNRSRINKCHVLGAATVYAKLGSSITSCGFVTKYSQFLRSRPAISVEMGNQLFIGYNSISTAAGDEMTKFQVVQGIKPWTSIA